MLPDSTQPSTSPSTGVTTPPGTSLGLPAIGSGVLAIVLAKVADLLSSIESVATFTITFVGIEMTPLLVTTTVIVCIAGYVALSYGLFQRFVAHVTGARRWVLAAALLAIVTGLSWVTWAAWAGPNPHAVLSEQLRVWNEAILSAQAKSGGIRTNPRDPDTPPQAWTTAQALVAILSDPSLTQSGAQAIREAFDYLERTRLPGGGWGYWEESTWAVTEITAWVVVAYARSMASEHVWPAEERSDVGQRIERDVHFLLDRQTPGGAWGPVALRDQDGVRTYSTVMALWALAEAVAVPPVTQLLTSHTGRPRVRDAFKWLTQHHDGEAGWFPNPRRRAQRERFPGLTAQALWVLYRVPRMHASFEPLRRDPAFMAAKNDFLQDEALWSRPVGQSERLSSADQHLRPYETIGPTGCECDFLIEGSTFLWYPWTLATLALIANDPALNVTKKRDAADGAARVAARFQELFQHLESGGVETYESAEAIIAIGPALATPG